MTRRDGALLLLILGLLAGAELLLVFLNRSPAAADASVAQVGNAGEPRRPTPSNESVPALETHAPEFLRVAGVQPTHESSSVDRGVPSSPGRLRVRAIDGESHAVVDKIRVRALSATRLADRESDSSDPGVELVLTPDTYAVLVMAKGYEGAELPATAIAAGESSVLDAVSMRSGSARILGTVSGDPWAAGSLHVELLGEGRRPCPECTEDSTTPCSQCGYSPGSSRLAVPATGRFVFDRLVSGPYLLRLSDAEERAMCEPRPVDLEPGQTLSLDVRFGAPRDVHVEVIDVDGVSLAPEWAARLIRGGAADGSEPESEIVEGKGGPSTAFQCEFRTGTRSLGSSTIDPPSPDPSLGIRIGVGVGCRRGAMGARKRGVSDDRPRREGEDLRPPKLKPSFAPSFFPSDLDADGLARFASLPSIDLTLVMTCGPFKATAEIPSYRNEVRLRAALFVAEAGSAGGEGDAPAQARTFREYESRSWR